MDCPFHFHRVPAKTNLAVAMPLFNWSSAEAEAILNDRFWIYWAVTLPLTVVVISTWWFWKNWRQRKDSTNDQAALQETPQQEELQAEKQEVPFPSQPSGGITHFVSKLRRRNRLRIHPQSAWVQSTYPQSVYAQSAWAPAEHPQYASPHSPYSQPEHAQSAVPQWLDSQSVGSPNMASTRNRTASG